MQLDGFRATPTEQKNKPKWHTQPICREYFSVQTMNDVVLVRHEWLFLHPKHAHLCGSDLLKLVKRHVYATPCDLDWQALTHRLQSAQILRR